jgi:hypothetical protein
VSKSSGLRHIKPGTHLKLLMVSISLVPELLALQREISSKPNWQLAIQEIWKQRGADISAALQHGPSLYVPINKENIILRFSFHSEIMQDF